jgi:hypothetical protein
MTLALDASIRNGMLDQITTRAGASALLRIYDGSRPATGGTATNKLAELTCNATFAPGASGGVLTLNAITQDSSGSDLNLNSTSIVTGGTVSISSFTITAPNA